MRGEGRGRRGFFVLDDFEICFNSLTEPGSHHHTEHNLAIFLNKSNSRRSDHGAKERWLGERKKNCQLVFIPETSGAFLESPENISVPKSHL